MNKVRWGVLGTASIALTKVIPAMQRGRFGEIAAIASRSETSAREAAAALGIPLVYGSYEALLADAAVDAVYIPLPNHLHVPWSIRALEAGLHVLCEKPIGLNAAEAEQLLTEAYRRPHLKIMEAFMYRHHPQWREAKRLVDAGHLGEIKSIQSFFSYHNDDPGNIRNRLDAGGGGLMDIGCYSVSLARFLFGTEPVRVAGHWDIETRFGTDVGFSGMLEFPSGNATFTCATLLQPHQRVNILGTRGRLEILIPFNAPPDEPCRAVLDTGQDAQTLEFEVCDQYTIQGDLMSRAILDDAPVPTPLKDAVENMKVLDALRRSARRKEWISLA